MRTVFFPGPSGIPKESIDAMSKEIVHHHSIEYSNLLTNIDISLKNISLCSGNVSIITGSGTSSAETIFDNYVQSLPKTEHLVCCNGRFSVRWASMLEVKNQIVRRYSVDYGMKHSTEELLIILKKFPNIKTVWFVHGETSTGVLNPIKELVDIVKSFRNSILCIVDAVSTIGSEQFLFDDWGIDIAFTTSCKGLISPAGLGCIFVKNSVKYTKTSRFSDNLELHTLTQPWTPPIQIMYAFEKSLKMITDFGVDKYREHIQSNKKLLCLLLQKNSIPMFGLNSLNTVTVVALPRKENFLEHLHFKYSLKLIGAQDHLKSKYFRIGTFGFIEKDEIETVVSILSNYY